MGDTGSPIIDHMDSLAEMTGVPKLSRQIETVPARPIRILPWLLIGVAIGGLWDQALGDVWGYGAIGMAFCATNFVQLVGPFRQSGLWPWRDEREADLFRRGHLMGLAVTMAITVVGCFYFGFVTRHGHNLWMPSKSVDWNCLAMFLIAVEGNVATLAASRHWPREPIEDE